MSDDTEQTQTQSEQKASDPEPEGRREDGVLTPAEIVKKHQNARAGLVSRSGLRNKIRTDLEAYHTVRGWGAPDDEKVNELLREVLS